MMLERYFQYQADLAATERNMMCPKDCDAPGCWMTEVVVSVSVFDLIRLSLALNTPVSNLFLNHCRFGFQCNELNPRYLNLSIKMEKPCPFLQKARCRIHSFKPFDCVFFPEYHQIAGLLPELAKRPVFKRFPCLKSKITVSDQRSQALKELKKMSSREEALSGYFLLEVPCFIIDTKPLVKQLKKSGLKSKSFSAENYRKELYEQLKIAGLFDGIMDKFTRLDTRQEMESLLGQLENKTLIKSLLEKKERPEIVFRVDENRLKPVKRYLQRSDLIFM
jgi:Fe-S-cluster containining protein